MLLYFLLYSLVQSPFSENLAAHRAAQRAAHKKFTFKFQANRVLHNITACVADLVAPPSSIQRQRANARYISNY